ncbi:ribbon-helix-helix protein, CopG family [Patescibacteria group bacterium]|nr:ribbon-helix-helix protein, CopG family [Patescibacteria group bacterium]
MSTISVPLSKELITHLDQLVASTGATRAAVMRKALENLAEDEAVEAVLRAEREVADGKILRGDIKKLLSK